MPSRSARDEARSRGTTMSGVGVRHINAARGSHLVASSRLGPESTVDVVIDRCFGRRCGDVRAITPAAGGSGADNVLRKYDLVISFGGLWA